MILNGTPGDDALSGTTGDDQVAAGGGNDTVRLEQGGNDSAGLGEGDDTVYLGAALNGGDSIDGGAGSDRLFLQGNYNLALTGANLRGIETLILMRFSDGTFGGGGSMNDRYTITIDDGVVAAGGTLVVDGRALGSQVIEFDGSAETDGNLYLYGGGFTNILFAGAGNDYLVSGSGVLSGGLGDDVFIVSSRVDLRDDGGFDAVYTTDVFVLPDGVAIELLATTFTDQTRGAYLTGNSASQTIIGTNGSNRLRGLAGNDFLRGLGGDDELDGGTGIDVLEGGTGNDLYYVDTAADAIIEVAGAGDDTVLTSATFVLLPGVSVETLRVDPTAVNVAGYALYGNEFAQLIQGGERNDSLFGRAGNDVLNGQGGDDVLDGGAGADIMTGGLGDDIYFVDDTGDEVRELYDAGFDAVYTTTSYAIRNDALIELFATTASGGTAAIDLTGTNHAQTIIGNAGANTILGLGGYDYLQGLEGDDVLDGGSGTDVLEGGAGADVFRFTSASDTPVANPDQIRDFQIGTDRIDLSAIDADSNAAGNQDFRWIGSNAFSGIAGELRVEVANGQSYISGDVNGDGQADFAIVVNNVTGLSLTDFLGIGSASNGTTIDLAAVSQSCLIG